MKSLLITKWLLLLEEFSIKRRLNFKTQNIYSSSKFYAVCSEFEKLGWVKRFKALQSHGCVEKLNFEISIEGEFVALAMSELFKLKSE